MNTSTPLALVVDNTTVDLPQRDFYLYIIGELKTLMELSGTDAAETSVGVLRLKTVIDVLMGLYGRRSKTEISYFLEQAAQAILGETVAETAEQSKAPDLDITALDREIERREAHLAEIMVVAMDIEDYLENIEHHEQELERQLEFAAAADKRHLREEIGRLKDEQALLVGGIRSEITTLSEQSKVDLGLLKRLRQARIDAASPLPGHLIGATLPAMPPFSREVSKAVIAEASAAESSRRFALESIAETAGLSPGEVFIYSLYELFGEGNKWLRNPERKAPLNRSCIRVVNTALSVMPGFGWANFGEVIKSANLTPERQTQVGYLEFRGNVGGKFASYLRTNKPLPWRVSDLFNPEEVARFVLEMKSART